KAFGVFGAFVAGPAELVDLLVQRARTYIYTTALPPAVAEAVRASLNIIRHEPERRRHLAALVAQFRHGAKVIGLDLMPSTTPVQPLLVGGERDATGMSDALLERGFMVTAIRPPTVPAGSSRLRITLSAAHTPDQVDALLRCLGEVRQ
ncbi:MAG: 8-amino-7-oxononanoate synthase, partial [Gammaproteobacteria bacterium]